jgi:hypothetical protein
MEPTNNLLDEPISEYLFQIINAARKLKNNKSAYSDKIRNEMLKYSTNILLQGYKKLFNLILETGSFPDQWCEGLITPIFKSGDKTNPNYYRGICVTSCLSKFFCIILNDRLSNFSYQQSLVTNKAKKNWISVWPPNCRPYFYFGNTNLQTSRTKQR